MNKEIQTLDWSKETTTTLLAEYSRLNRLYGNYMTADKTRVPYDLINEMYRQLTELNSRLDVSETFDIITLEKE